MVFLMCSRGDDDAVCDRECVNNILKQLEITPADVQSPVNKAITRGAAAPAGQSHHTQPLTALGWPANWVN